MGAWHKVPIMTGFTHNEGSLYVNHAMAESDEFTHFFRELLPLLSDEDITTIDQLYPDPQRHANSPYQEDRPGVGAQYKRIEAAYAQYAYVAPVRQTAHFASEAVPVYLYHWALITSVDNGAQHGDNMRYEVCDPRVLALDAAHRELAERTNAYVTSFIVHGDPNTTQGRHASRPKWERLHRDKPCAMALGKRKTAEFEEDTWARKECEFWWSKVDISQQ